MRGLVKGAVFESEVSYTLEQFERAIVISNLVLYSHYLESPTEIDKLIISPHGIFVVEVKSFSTSLHGRFSDEFWTGITGKTSTKIYSPVRQNFEHIRTLNNALHRIGGKFYPLENIVIVPDSSKINSDCNQVMNLSNFVSYFAGRSVEGIKFSDIKAMISDLQEVVKQQSKNDIKSKNKSRR